MSIPVRFSDESVTRYAPTITAMLDSWPQPIRVACQDLSPETVRGRFRDAMQGVMRYGFGPPNLKERLTLIGGPSAVMVVQQDHELVIGSKEVLRKAARAASNLSVSSKTTIVSALAQIGDSKVATGQESKIVGAIITLIEAGILTSIELSGVTEDFVWSCIGEDSEVQVTTQTNGSVLLF